MDVSGYCKIRIVAGTAIGSPTGVSIRVADGTIGFYLDTLQVPADAGRNNVPLRDSYVKAMLAIMLQYQGVVTLIVYMVTKVGNQGLNCA